MENKPIRHDSSRRYRQWHFRPIVCAKCKLPSGIAVKDSKQNIVIKGTIVKYEEDEKGKPISYIHPECLENPKFFPKGS